MVISLVRAEHGSSRNSSAIAVSLLELLELSHSCYPSSDESDKVIRLNGIFWVYCGCSVLRWSRAANSSAALSGGGRRVAKVTS